MVETPKKEATPVELSALLMDAVCTPSERERVALGELAGHLGVELGQLQSELMFLRAFALDFAIGLALGEGPEQRAILVHLHQHWERLDKDIGAGLLQDLEHRFALYGEEVGSSGGDSTGLSGLVGRVFARCCQSESQGEDLALLGGSMFSAFFAEIADLFEEIEVVLISGEGVDEDFLPN